MACTASAALLAAERNGGDSSEWAKSRSAQNVDKILKKRKPSLLVIGTQSFHLTIWSRSIEIFWGLFFVIVTQSMQ